jgi:hypothetical protein
VSQENNKQIVEDINSLLVQGGTIAHDLDVGEDKIIRVWVKELSFLDTQRAIKEFMSIDANGQLAMDMAGYWKYMFMEAVEKTEPNMSKSQLMRLKPDVAKQITSLLPQPQDLVAGPLEDGLSE